MTTLASGYRGARFYKCDLQVQTPEDGGHWAAGDPLRLPNPRPEQDLQEKARQFLRRCHEVGLEVIGVTDHNFSDRQNEREWFLTHLIQQNETVAREQGREPLLIFPGFELDIGYHLLCLFDPGTSLRQVSTCLTTLGLPEGSRFSNSGVPIACRFEGRPVSLDTVLRVVQEEIRGIAIAAHAFSNDGIAKSGRDASDYRDERLLAVEAPAVPLTGRVKSILEGNDPSWNRKRRPAYVLSSDCKKLRPERDGDTNFIGFRHTWIKMSGPSIQALRQAFLDRESRIRFGEQRPEEAYSYPKIMALHVRGAKFLTDQDHFLSPNLNTLIGGRGTGKSTLVEYLRVALDQERMIQGDEPRKNLEKLKRTILSGTTIHAEIEKEGQTWTVECAGNAAPRVSQGQPVPDIGRFFPTRILSQKEIYAIAEDRGSRGRLVDNLIRRELDELGRRNQDLGQEIRALNEKIVAEPELEERKKALDTERVDYQARLDHLKALEEPLRKWKGLLAEEGLLNGLETEGRRISSSVREVIDGAEFACTSLGSELRESPNSTLVRSVADQADALARTLCQSILGALEVFEKGLADLLTGKELQAWRKAFEEAHAEFDLLRKELADGGTDPDQYLAYQRQLRERQVQIAEIQQRLDGMVELRARRESKIKELHAVWAQETRLRELTAKTLTDAVPRTSAGQPFVRVTVEAYGDDRAFAQEMQALVQDRRRISNEDWGTFDDDREHKILPEDSFLAEVVAARATGQSPVEVLLAWVEALRSGQQPTECPWGPQDRRTKALLGWFSEGKLADLRLWRPPDRVRVELFRQDGSLAGELEEGLSIGQRCTAVLALLLAQENVPAIIDQPEEDLDNEFVYRELVPLLRRVKERRQLIIATHNANIPVNADAELILALEARDERGQLKEVNGQVAAGALDREPVRLAVEEIMEGSEEAFRRRFEKYGF